MIPDALNIDVATDTMSKYIMANTLNIMILNKDVMTLKKYIVTDTLNKNSMADTLNKDIMTLNKDIMTLNKDIMILSKDIMTTRNRCMSRHMNKTSSTIT